jgi:hypothetical protein
MPVLGLKAERVQEVPLNKGLTGYCSILHDYKCETRNKLEEERDDEV